MIYLRLMMMIWIFQGNLYVVAGDTGWESYDLHDLLIAHASGVGCGCVLHVHADPA